MRKIILWSGFPAVLVVVGTVLWFTLIPSRSGAG
jgi:cytochrome c-type biogenesis protein CcmH/NrfF